MEERQEVPFSCLEGATLQKVEFNEWDGGTIVTFETDKGTFEMKHIQNCCEQIHLDSPVWIRQQLESMVGTIIKAAYSTSSKDDSNDDERIQGFESFTWTFYTIKTNNITTVMRWLGVSNGYYSESVRFFRIISPIDSFSADNIFPYEN